MNLRNDIADVLYACGETKGDALLVSHAVIEALAGAATDPVRLRAILELLGLEAREGTLIEYKPVPYDPEPGWVVEPSGDIHEKAGHHAGAPVLVCRVRPQGEQADG